MRIEFEGTPDEVRAQVFEFFGIGTEEQQPTPITGAAPKSPGRPRKMAAPPPLDRAAASPAAPSPAQPATQMMPACSDHAKTLAPNMKAVPAEKSACIPCQNEAKPAGGKAMTLEEVIAVAEQFGESRPDGWDILFRVLGTMGAESLTGAVDKATGKPTVALEPAKYEEFAKQLLSIEAPKPARKSI